MPNITQLETSEKTVILQKGGVTIIIDGSSINRAKQLASNAVLGEFVSEGLDPTACADEITRLINLAERIAKHEDIDIFDYLTLTKSGTLNRTKNVLLADSKVTDTWNGEYFSRKGLQLRLEWFYVCSDVENVIGKNTDAITLRIDWYDASKKLEPIFDRDDQPHTVAQTRASYIKTSDLVPGHVYAEKSGTEWLYLGSIPVKEETFFFEDKSDCPADGTIPTQSAYITDLSNGYIHVRWTKKLQGMLGSVKDLNDFIRLMAETEKQGTPWYQRASYRREPRKFVSEVCAIFDGSKIRKETARTPMFPHYSKPNGCTVMQYYIG